MFKTHEQLKDAYLTHAPQGSRVLTLAMPDGEGGEIIIYRAEEAQSAQRPKALALAPAAEARPHRKRVTVLALAA